MDSLQNRLTDIVANNTSTFKGYISAVVHCDLANPNRIVIVEEWESPEDFRAYMGSYSDEQKAEMSENLQEPPDIKILDMNLN